MKTNSFYRMPSDVKRMLAFVDKGERAFLKRLFIDASINYKNQERFVIGSDKKDKGEE